MPFGHLIDLRTPIHFFSVGMKSLIVNLMLYMYGCFGLNINYVEEMSVTADITLEYMYNVAKSNKLCQGPYIYFILLGIQISKWTIDLSLCFMYKEKALIDWSAIGKGFIAGGLLSGFYLLHTHLLLKSLVFIYGIIVMLDALIPKKEEHDYPLLSLFGLFVGFLVAFWTKLIKFDSYLLIVIAIASVIYLYKLLSYRRLHATRI